jgi:CHAT domain-containing protein
MPSLMTKHTLLFLAANPAGTDRLALDREARAIQVELERSGSRDQFEFVTRWAAEPLDLLRELRRLRPTVVHFSGHGQQVTALQSSPDEARRDVVGSLDDSQHGLFFQAADGMAQLVSAAAIEETFGAAGSSVRLVVLNACYSATQAEALLAHVDCVVGMTGAIRDDTARHFAVGFYGGLGEREPIEAAFKQGRAAIALAGPDDRALPQLRTRAGVDANRIILTLESAPYTRLSGMKGSQDVGPKSNRQRKNVSALLISSSAAMPAMPVIIDRRGTRRDLHGHDVFMESITTEMAKLLDVSAHMAEREARRVRFVVPGKRRVLRLRVRVITQGDRRVEVCLVSTGILPRGLEPSPSGLSLVSWEFKNQILTGFKIPFPTLDYVTIHPIVSSALRYLTRYAASLS